MEYNAAADRGTVKTLEYEVPQAEYMYGCTATCVGMLLGYYDRWGYCGYDVSDLIDGKVEINARGRDGNKYDMDAFDTVLGSAIASREYVDRFYKKSAAEEYGHTFSDDYLTLNTEEWNCIADFLGTGQYWRDNSDLSTSFYYNVTLEYMMNLNRTITVSGGGISIELPRKYNSLLYGLNLYVENAGYKLDAQETRNVNIDSNNGEFSFGDYCAEIDAGRAVLIHLHGHSVLGYGYDKITGEIIFDDTYEHDCRMKWGEAYYYSNAWRDMKSVTLVRFDTSGLYEIKQKPYDPLFVPNTKNLTNRNVTVKVEFDDDFVINEYSFDKIRWYSYTSGGIVFEENGTVYVRSEDSDGIHWDGASYTVSNIDKLAPMLSISGNAVEWTNRDIVLSAVSDDGTIEYFNGTEWIVSSAVTVSQNGTYKFRAVDRAGNVTSKSVVVNRIDKDAPTLKITGNALEWTNKNVVLNAVASDGIVQYFNGTDWITASTLSIENNGIYKFRVTDRAGNVTFKDVVVDKIDKIAPTLEIFGNAVDWTFEDIILTADASDGVVEYFDGEKWMTGNKITVLLNGTYKFKVTDPAGNVTEKEVVVDKIIAPQNMKSSRNGLSWDGVSMADRYYLKLNSKLAEGTFLFEVSSTEVDLYVPTRDTLSWQLSINGRKWVDGSKISINTSAVTIFNSDSDGNIDLFFAGRRSTWSQDYYAEYKGSAMLDEKISLAGKNRISDVYEGSTDANIFILTDDSNGDALFLDDIFSSFGDRARLSMLDEIRAGAGDDIIDMTSSRFEYVGEGVKIYGGSGNDTIWANNGNNTLFGDAGNDRIVGGSGNDVIVGGAGDDKMHGGGGEDIFCFGGDWGNDMVEQLAGGKVTLWFEDGSESNWNASTLTYTDGANSVTVIGTADVTLSFGADAASDESLFADFASDRIFEDKVLIA